jgi:hypothetical protein
MLEAIDRIPPILQVDGEDERLHVFFIHSPIALIMSIMIADAYRLPPEKILAVSQRSMDTKLSGFETTSLRPKKYDRYFNRITGRNLGAIRLGQELRRRGREFVVYAAWFYPEIEEIARSPLCDGVVVFEEGQLSYHPATPYEDTLLNTWRFRRKRLLSGTIDYWFRRDIAAYISLSTEAFPAMPAEKRFVLGNIDAAARKYIPRLEGIESIGLVPAPRRLPADAVFRALEILVRTIPGRGVIRLHPGYKFESYYSVKRFSDFIEGVSEGRVGLCPEDAVIELEMARESKTLYGAQTSLSRYAEVFGSKFVEVSFPQYIKPVI